jgi:hypothetical protein
MVRPCSCPASDRSSPGELAATVARTLNLPEIQKLRPRLLPELPIFGHQDVGNSEILISGIADAVAAADSFSLKTCAAHITHEGNCE